MSKRTDDPTGLAMPRRRFLELAALGAAGAALPAGMVSPGMAWAQGAAPPPPLAPTRER